MTAATSTVSRQVPRVCKLVVITGTGFGSTAAIGAAAGSITYLRGGRLPVLALEPGADSSVAAHGATALRVSGCFARSRGPAARETS